MAYRVNHYNKNNGTTYVYEAVSFWDKEKKRPSNKQICVGKLDKDTGEFIPSLRMEDKQNLTRKPDSKAVIHIIGQTLLFDKIVNELGLYKILRKCFPSTFLDLLTITYFLVSKRRDLSKCEDWCKGYENPLSGILSNERINELLKDQTEDERQAFLNQWSKKVSESDYLCYGIKLHHINFAMLFTQNSRIPVCYEEMLGHINNIDTVKKLIKTLDYVNISHLHMVMYSGFYSKANIDELLEYKHKFTFGVPIQRQWVKKIINEFYEEIVMPDNYRKIDEESFYVKTQLYSWGEDSNRTYLHVYYNSHYAAAAFDEFTEDLLGYKEELENGELVKNNEEYYQHYFIIKETPKRGCQIQYNNDAIQEHRNRYSGFFVLLSNATRDAIDALKIYRNKEVIENNFVAKRIPVQESNSMDGSIFVQFLAQILNNALEEKIRTKRELAMYTVSELLEEMNTLTKTTYSGRNSCTINEVTNEQHIIMEAFSIDLKLV